MGKRERETGETEALGGQDEEGKKGAGEKVSVRDREKRKSKRGRKEVWTKTEPTEKDKRREDVSAHGGEANRDEEAAVGRGADRRELARDRSGNRTGTAEGRTEEQNWEGRKDEKDDYEG